VYAGVVGDRQHYLPAAMLGGFGRRRPNRPARYAAIAVRDLASGSVRLSNADSEAHRRALYRLADPPPGVDRDVVDKIWDTIEPRLPDLVRRAETRTLVQGDDELLLNYAASVYVRHPSFSKVAEHHQATHGAPAPKGDDVQILRMEGLQNQRKSVAEWRWRVLHTCPGAPRFVISDLGFIGVRDGPHGDTTGELINATFVPLSPRVGLLAYLDHPELPRREPPFSEHRDVIPSWVYWLNACATSRGRGTVIEPQAVFGHPDDIEALKALPDVRSVRPNSAGPFRGTGVSAVTFFE
jgi:hypothetical protein